jgi:hypothetical protein
MADEPARSAESVAHWRDMMDDPCTCSPGDGSDECERYHECLSAWLRVCHAARNDGREDA